MAPQLDLDAASRLIGVVYDAALLNDRWLLLLRHLSLICPGHVATLARFSPQDWETPEHDDLYHAIARRSEPRLGVVVSTRSLFSDEKLRGFQTYRSRMAPNGAGHWEGIYIDITPHMREMILLVENDWSSERKDPQFAGTVLRLLAPHLIRAQNLARMIPRGNGATART